MWRRCRRHRAQSRPILPRRRGRSCAGSGSNHRDNHPPHFRRQKNHRVAQYGVLPQLRRPLRKPIKIPPKELPIPLASLPPCLYLPLAPRARGAGAPSAIRMLLPRAVRVPAARGAGASGARRSPRCTDAPGFSAPAPWLCSCALPPCVSLWRRPLAQKTKSL